MAQNRTTQLVSILLFFSFLIGLSASDLASDSAPELLPVSIATVTYSSAVTPDQQAMVEWALERFADAGLKLPDLEISFPTTCGGKAGRYVVGRGQIELCRSHRKIVLHELAHAWDDSADLDREGFLELRGLEEWYDRPGLDANQTGGEQLALIVTWALFDGDLTKPVSPLDSGSAEDRFLPGLDNSAPNELAESFTFLTGS